MPKIALILSGPTHEYIDPVRFIGNASSGLMGRAIAQQAIEAGYSVEFVSGPVAPTHLPESSAQCHIHPVTSAAQMLEKAQSLHAKADLAIFTAAVADYTPADPKTEKMAKSDEALHLTLKPTADIAKTLGKEKQPHQIHIGFALQTADGEKHARAKLMRKNLDGIVLNTPTSLGASTGHFTFISPHHPTLSPWGQIDKTACAKHIFEAIHRIES